MSRLIVKCWLPVVWVFAGGLCLATTSPAQETAVPSAAEPAEAAKHGLPQMIDYSRQISALIKAEATAKTDAERIAAVRGMARVYTQLKRDPRLLESETLRSYRAKLWGRLNFIRKRWEREIARLERQLGEQADVRIDLLTAATTGAISDGLDLTAATMGGPALILASGCETQAGHDALGGAGRLDFGRELVELIERTISPDFWDTNGGPGTIVYYAPLKALVIRATAEVHAEVGGVLGAVR